MRELTIPRDRIKTAAHQACRIALDAGPGSHRFATVVAERIWLFAPTCTCSARFRDRICTTMMLVKSSAWTAAAHLPATAQPSVVDTYTNLVRADAAPCCCLLPETQPAT